MRNQYQETLFEGDELRDVLNSVRVGLEQRISSENRDVIAQTDEAEYVQSMVEQHKVVVPRLDIESQYVAKRGDTQIDVSGRLDYAPSMREGPSYVAGTYVTVAIPFTGLEVWLYL